MQTMRTIGWLLPAVSILFGVPTANAGVFSVKPVRIHMAPRDRAVAVVLVNEGATDILLQADLNAWRQTPGGEDEQTPTDDMMLAPPIVKLAPRARQVVRLALLRPADPQRQLTYRMVIREVPQALEQNESGVRAMITLALSIPVFVTPASAKAAITCTDALRSAGGFSVRCANEGSAYAQVRSLEFKHGSRTVAKFEGGAYILPGASKTITGDRLVSEAVPAGPLGVHLRYDDGTTQAFDLVLR